MIFSFSWAGHLSVSNPQYILSDLCFLNSICFLCCKTNDHKVSNLKQHTLSHSFYALKVYAHLSWVLPKTAVKVTGGVGLYLTDLLPSSLMLLAEVSSLPLSDSWQLASSKSAKTARL